MGFAPLRCAVDIHVVGKKETLMRKLEKYEAATKEDSSFYVRVGVTSSSKGKKNIAYRVVNGRGEDVMSSDAKPVKLESILPEVDEERDDAGGKNKKKNGKKQKKSPGKQSGVQQAEQAGNDTNFLRSLEYGDIANVDLLVSLAPIDPSAEVAAPVVTIPPPSSSKPTNRHFHVHCDALVIVPVDSSLQAALSPLRQQIYQQLEEISKRLEDAPDTVVSVAAHQFPLVGAAFPLTLVSCSTSPTYSNDESMDDVALLESLHHAFLQPVQQSLFRVSRGCSLAQQGEWLAASDVLYNVHEGIPSSGVSAQGHQGKLALVDGFYGYYHYMQQRVNDKGWGCAYRSLQTLASWLFVQHYTQQKFLSHEQIQRALVQMGDKPSRFQGSTEWIGSLEVGYVLDELFGVTFRSLSVSSGAQLPDVARELLDHFETQGTPVMMGGGQLAFTLLGVDYDPDSDACAFLTLDPHYTGDEDLTTIQQQTVQLEGYKAVPCSWRKTTSFTKKSFYNLCLPQRPSVGV
ncbi:Ufm1-specific protease 2 [Phytophthora boehmeriae]|uniref:Ufm1-specific protease 2 n=1 Tax=Phytophthora boehmeriae TaxID=109152 RepID=A0A8T1W0N4_9STRA|nr:Ufm1-specific protease 2 [Phytophthora boehmeriae]